MKQNAFLLVAIIFILFCGFTSLYNTPKKIELTSLIQKTEAGKSLSLSFDVPENCNLFINHSYGKTILTGQRIGKKITFKIPDVYTQKTGNISWFLINQDKIIQKGNTEIYPSSISKKPLEAYLGPPSTLVGAPHFVMFVTIPTDIYDNPMPTNTKVLYKNQFFDKIENKTIKTKNLIAWHNIFAPTKSGKVFISASAISVPTKEFEAIIYPNVPTNFSINFSSPHSFADGNQITNLYTSSIKDKYGNIVSDATQVNFQITTSKGTQLTTQGLTLNGIANTQILHPDHKEIYKIKAFVNGMAESNSISIDYKSITAQVPFTFTKNRTLTVGPIKSYMHQLVPDGITVTVKVYKQNELISEIKGNSLKGITNFNFPEEEFKAAQYRFEISVLGKKITTQKTFYVNNKQQK